MHREDKHAVLYFLLQEPFQLIMQLDTCRGPGSNPGRDMLFFFVLFWLAIYYQLTRRAWLRFQKKRFGGCIILLPVHVPSRSRSFPFLPSFCFPFPFILLCNRLRGPWVRNLKMGRPTFFQKNIKRIKKSHKPISKLQKNNK